jgi:glyoxylase-like metal-dependent hydrolase (beta-lactamase superfamily II)
MDDLTEAGCLDTVPVPDSAYILEATPGGYHAIEVKPKFWWLSDGAYGSLLYIPTTDDKPTILIDAPPTHGENLRDRIASLLPKNRELDIMIYSHYHGDHIGGASLITEQWPDVHIVAHKDTKWELDVSALAGSTLNIPLPNQIFSTRLTVGPYELKDAIAAHAPGNIYIYAKCEKVLMIVDVIFPGWVPYYSWAMSQNFGRWLDAHDEILKYDFDVLIGGHLTRPGNREDAVIQRQFFDDLKIAVEEADKKVDLNEIYEKLGGQNNPWLIFDEKLDRVGQLCYNDMVAKYSGVLGAVDIITQAHCYTMAEFLSIG